MRLVLLTLAIATGACAFGGSGAMAQSYPWCAYYAKAGANCGFATYEQCMAALSGNGGFCNVNSEYVPPGGPHGSRAYQPP